MARKKEKHYYLHPDTIEGIEKYAAENHMKASEVIEMLWKNFIESEGDDFDNKIQKILDAIDAKYKNQFTGIRLASRQSEKNSHIILEVLNTFAVEHNYKSFLSTKHASPVITGATEFVEDKINNYKQNADWRKR